MGFEATSATTTTPGQALEDNRKNLVDPWAKYKTATPTGQTTYQFPDYATYKAAIDAGLDKATSYYVDPKTGGLAGGPGFNYGDNIGSDPNWNANYKANQAAYAAKQPTYQWVDTYGVTHTSQTTNPGGDSALEGLGGAVTDFLKDPGSVNTTKEKGSTSRYGDGTPINPVMGADGGGGGGGGSGGDGSAAQAARDFADQLKAERDAAAAAGPRGTTQVTAGQATAGQVDPNAVKKVGGTAATYTPGAITATPTASVQTGPAGSMTAGSAGAGSVTAGQIDPNGNLIDLNTDSRRQQQEAVDLAAGAARGTAPSAAQELMKESVDRGAAAQLGAAASLQGRNPGQALRTGVMGASDVFAKSAATSAALRADEMAQARRDFLGGTQQLRAGDVDVQKANQSTVLQANMANLSADTQAKIASLNAQTQAAIATLQAQTEAGKSNLAAQTQVQLANLQAQMQKAHDDAANELQAKIASGQISLESFKATLAANTSLSAADIDAQVRLLMTNANNTTQTNIANTGFALDASKTNANNELVARQVDDALALGKGTQLIQALGLPADADKARILAEAAKHAGDQALWGQLLTAAGATAVALSDFHAKENIRDGREIADDFLDGLRPKTFGYKDPKDGPGYQLGIIAQDLPTRTTMRNPKDGKLWINANVISEVLAGLGRVNQRLKKVEGTRG